MRQKVPIAMLEAVGRLHVHLVVDAGPRPYTVTEKGDQRDLEQEQRDGTARDDAEESPPPHREPRQRLWKTRRLPTGRVRR
jgi:hypothetical protein